MPNKTKLHDMSVETSPGVFHAIGWNSILPEDLFAELISVATSVETRKARLCLHPNSDEIMQVTYLAFKAPYSDRIHQHSERPEVLIPIFGLASQSTFDGSGERISLQYMDGSKPKTFSTPSKIWHSLEVLSDAFVMIEIGIGPFSPISTTYR